MGQYYKVIILGDQKKNNKEVILLVINPGSYGNGAKLMENAYMNNDLLNTVEYLISNNGPFYKSRIIWAGDYANEEDSENLYHIADNYSSYENIFPGNNKSKYIVNHTKKMYVDKEKCEDNEIHPLPLLVSEGNGQGGGDYYGNNLELCGSWSRDVISMEESLPLDYIELIPEFNE
jgi:hypothetical protein